MAERTCKDCFHYKACKEGANRNGFWDIRYTEQECKHFLPASDVVEVKHAKWEINSDGYYPYCVRCKTEPKNGLMSKYCPECGAVMDGTPKERGGEK